MNLTKNSCKSNKKHLIYRNPCKIKGKCFLKEKIQKMVLSKYVKFKKIYLKNIYKKLGYDTLIIAEEKI